MGMILIIIGTIIYVIWISRLVSFGVRTATQINASTAATAAQLAILVDAMTPEAKERVASAIAAREQAKRQKIKQMDLPPFRLWEQSIMKSSNGKGFGLDLAVVGIIGAIIVIGLVLFANYGAHADSILNNNPQTRFYDARGNSVGTATTDSQGTTTFRDSRGNTIGRSTRPQR